MNEDIETILTKVGFDLKNDGSSYWRALPIYRESSNGSVLRISKEHGGFVDFAANVKGSLYELVRLALGLQSIKDARTWIDGEGYEIKFVEKKPKIVLDKKIETKYVEGLMPHYAFYEERGISIETLKSFECGVCFSGKQSNRFVFVIRNEEGDVRGVVGRDLLGGRIKWKKMGDSRKWIFPLTSIDNILEKKTVILVESVGDTVALYDIGIKNVICLFGLEISSTITSFLSTFNLNTIHISLNNDINKDKNWGQLASESIKSKLSKLVDSDKIKITPPPYGDWGEIEKEERLNIAKTLRLT